MEEAPSKQAGLDTKAELLAELNEADTPERFNELAAQYMREKLTEEGYTEVKAEPAAAIRSQIDVDPETLELAYSDLEGATAGEQKAILDARETVMENADSWFLDEGGFYIVEINEEDKTWREPARFSELFPDWDPPTHPVEEDSSDDAQNAPAARSIVFDSVVGVPKFVPHTITAPFNRWSNLQSKVYVVAETVVSLNGISSINLGISNLTNGQNTSLYSATRKGAGYTLGGAIDGSKYSTIGFRASSYDNSGEARIVIGRD